MLHGKKGFERIVWAFKNVLVSAVTWLFYDFEVKPDGSTTTTRKAPPPPLSSSGRSYRSHGLTSHRHRDGTPSQVPPYRQDLRANPYYYRPGQFPRANDRPFRSLASNRIRRSGSRDGRVVKPCDAAKPSRPTERPDRSLSILLHQPIARLLGCPKPRMSTLVGFHSFNLAKASDPCPMVRFGPSLIDFLAFSIMRVTPSTQGPSTNALYSDQCLRHGPATPPWFSLSCQAFQTRVFDCTDGYTILAMLGRDDAEREKRPGSQESLVKSGSRSARCYVLWEHSQA